MEDYSEDRKVPQPTLFVPSKENNYFGNRVQIELEYSSDEIKEQIWGKAVLLYALENREGKIDPVNFSNRFFSLLSNNQQEAFLLQRNSFGKERYVKVPWRGDSIVLKYDEVQSVLDGFVVNVFPTNRESEDNSSDAVEISFSREDFEESEEGLEIYGCLLKGLEEGIYKEK